MINIVTTKTKVAFCINLPGEISVYGRVILKNQEKICCLTLSNSCLLEHRGQAAGQVSEKEPYF